VAALSFFYNLQPELPAIFQFLLAGFFWLKHSRRFALVRQLSGLTVAKIGCFVPKAAS
jgi:hypothetical protein